MTILYIGLMMMMKILIIDILILLSLKLHANRKYQLTLIPDMHYHLPMQRGSMYAPCGPESLP